MTASERSVSKSMLLAAMLWASCASVEDPAPPPLLDRGAFDVAVWPVLVRDCGFSTCHGSTDRFFRVVGPGHERLDPLMLLTEPVTEAELQFSYDRARAMVDAHDPGRSLLLRKPLELAAGGSGHEGADTFGLNVYRSAEDPSYQALLTWVLAPAP